MRYNQPYGTPEPPLGSYPRYVNGNPTTGTEGSIPPARAFDEDQIEIVTVIQNAGLTPDHNDLTQLWQALMALTAQRYITTPITKTVHGAGADFPDLHAAFDWLARYIITDTGYVTFAIPPGQWVYTTAVEVNHANSNRITIQGATLNAAIAPGNISCTGWDAAARANDALTNINYLRGVHRTELCFTGGITGFRVLRDGIRFNYLLLTGSQTTAPNPSGPGGHGIDMYGDIQIDGISIWGFGSIGLRINQAVARMVSSLTFTCCGNRWQGMTMDGGNFIAASGSYVILAGNDISGITNFGGWVWFDRVSIKGHGPPNGNAGVHCEQGGFIACNPGSAVQQNYAGIIIAGAATFLMQGSTYWNTATYHLYAVGTATCWCNNSQFSGTLGPVPIYAANGAYIEVTGSSIDKFTSPMWNTGGDPTGSYIRL